MPKFVVAQIDWFANELSLEIVTAKDWANAIAMHSRTMFNSPADIPATIEQMKQKCFDLDGMMDVVEITV